MDPSDDSAKRPEKTRVPCTGREVGRRAKGQVRYLRNCDADIFESSRGQKWTADKVPWCKMRGHNPS